jgi:spore coat polysaccharide biosynthesis protein SpsF
MSAVILIQARWGSSRLPGKVLLPLAGRPALSHVVARCRAARSGEVVVATSTAAGDDAVAAAAAACGAAVVRVTADCPLTDPALVAEVLAGHAAGGYDFSYNDVPAVYPSGYDVEVMTAAALAWVDGHCRDAASREHVTPYFFDHAADFKVLNVGGPAGLFPAGLRLALDEAADYELLGSIFERLDGRGLFGFRDVAALLAAEPDLLELNRAVRPKERPPTPPAK